MQQGAGLMAALNFESYAVLGWSDGANAAVHLAADVAPEKVQKLLIWGANGTLSAEDIEAFEATRDVRFVPID